MSKYEILTDDFIDVSIPMNTIYSRAMTGSYYIDKAVKRLYAIRLLKDLQFHSSNDIEPFILNAGAIGGRIESEDNLSQEGNCWVMKSSQICGDARIYDNAIVIGSKIFQSAKIFGNVGVFDSTVADTAEIYDNARVCNSSISGTAKIFGDARVTNSKIRDSVHIHGTAHVSDMLLQDKLIISEDFAKVTRSDGKSFACIFNKPEWVVYSTDLMKPIAQAKEHIIAREAKGQLQDETLLIIEYFENWIKLKESILV
jgi:hypothetical protein